MIIVHTVHYFSWCPSSLPRSLAFWFHFYRLNYSLARSFSRFLFFSYEFYNRVINLLLFDWLVHIREMALVLAFVDERLSNRIRAFSTGAKIAGANEQQQQQQQSRWNRIEKKKLVYLWSCNEMKLSTKIFYK